MCLEKSCLFTCELFSAFQFLHTQVILRRVDFSIVLAAVFFLTLSVLHHINVSYQIIFCCSASNASEYKSFSLLVHLGFYFLFFCFEIIGNNYNIISFLHSFTIFRDSI